MTMHINFDSIKNLSLEDARTFIVSHEKMRIGDIKLFDLISDSGHPLSSSQGIYMFFDGSGQTCLYVGKNSSLQFIERIPCHFAQSEHSWHNHFLKYFKKYANIESYYDSAMATQTCHLVLIHFDPQYINKAERIFRFIMAPKFNSVKAGIDPKLILSDAIK